MLKRSFVPFALQMSALALTALTSACGTNSASPTGTATGATSSATVVVTPTPTPTPTSTTVSSTAAPTPLVGEAPIADNFDTSAGLQTSPGSTEPPSTEEGGTSRVIC